MQGVGIGFGINGNCFNVQLLAGTDNADGDFAAVEDIMNVNGIGEKRFENIRDYITIED